MSTTLDSLYRLQDRLHFVDSQNSAREALPPELAEIDQAFQSKVEAIETLKTRIDDADAQRRKAETELADFQERLKKYQNQLVEVKTSREYGAMLNEIDGVKKQVRSYEETVLMLMETIEASRKELAERQERLPEETAAHEEALKDWRRYQQQIDAEIAGVREEIRQLESQIPRKMLADFQRLYEKKGGLAVVRAVGASCSACHVRIRPALFQELRARREVVYCDSCKRILYYEETAAASNS
jgi:uncharacterized protein